jgi:glycine/D-amino acid oxidase-like deaminating enzyme
MTRRPAPFWFDRVARTRRPSYAQLKGERQARVAIVGGGLTGCAIADAFASARISTIVLEADRVGAASSGNSGLVPDSFDASFIEGAGRYGLRAARSMWHDMHRASLEFAAVLRRLGVRCDLQPEDVLHVAAREAAAVKRLRREYQARRDAGIDVSWLAASAVSRETRAEAGGAMRTRGSGLDPYRACLGLAAAAASRGAEIFERSEVRRIKTDRRRVEVITARGSVRADAVIVATGAPIPDLRGLRRHVHPRQRYAVVTEPLPAAVRRELGSRSAAIRDDRDPPHLLRWLKDDRVLFCGADQNPVPARAQDKTLVQRAGQLMYELSVIYPAISGAQPEWTWASTYDDTVDGLPYIGTHRNFPCHLFAIGTGRHGPGASWLAARVLLRHFMERPAKGDHLFAFSRIL